MISSILTRRFPGDNPRTIAVREYIAESCSRFIKSGLADPKFQSELAHESDQKFWSCVSEALVAGRLCDKKFGQRKTVGEGPDFLVLDGDRKVWIEVICPEPKNVPNDWLNPKSGEAISFPHEEILLRWTSAIKAKVEILIGREGETSSGYIASGVVAPKDAYVIAVNGCRLRSGPFPALMGISQFPFAAEAVFPIGPYQVKIHKETLETVGGAHQHRPYILNKNRAQVPALTFLDSRFNPISAIWALDLNGESIIGNSEPSAVIHNPNALNPVPVGFLSADHEYVAIRDRDNFVLSRLSSSPRRYD